MKLRLKMALLMCLMAAAVFTGVEAWSGLRPVRENQVPSELYAPFAAQADAAEFFLRESGDYVAVFSGQRDRNPITVTGIELACLRNVDRAMIEAGLPAMNRHELLLLLEDLGS